MAEIVKTLIEQNKAMMETMETRSDKNETSGPSNLTKRPAEIQQQISKIKVTKFKMVPISKLPILATLSCSRPNKDTCTESDNSKVTSDVNPTTNVDEKDSNNQEDDNLSCL